MADFLHPLQSLKEGHWFKLICGASFQHLPAIRSLALVYALAGADCIDVAADPAIISTAREALAVADALAEAAKRKGLVARNPPWLMVSLNDGEDPHFRKAEFQASACPTNCTRPCETICPAEAIVFDRLQDSYSGVDDAACYGCGRCIPICPTQHISTRSYVYTPEVISPLILQSGIDAIEIHTQVGRLEDFKRLWKAIAPQVDQLRLLSVSCPDNAEVIDYLWALHEVMSPLPCSLIWQTDGRPMSGDIGDGATKACVKFGQKVLASNLPGYVQLAGGTNSHTVPKLKTLNLLQNRNSTDVPKTVSGVAYGSYARSLLLPLFSQLEARETEHLKFAQSVRQRSAFNKITASVTDHNMPALKPRSTIRLEDAPDLLWEAVDLAHKLISPLKSFSLRE